MSILLAQEVFTLHPAKETHVRIPESPINKNDRQVVSVSDLLLRQASARRRTSRGAGGRTRASPLVFPGLRILTRLGLGRVRRRMRLHFRK